MKFQIISIFPNIFTSYLSESILKRAQAKKIIKIKTHDLRRWTDDKRRTIDDAPYGGGAGMLMKIEPIYRALRDLKKSSSTNKRKQKTILLSASGKKWNQAMAKKYAKLEEIVLICGRYEGVDARLGEFIDEEISIGDYILTGGELPALVMIDSIVRLLPGTLGNQASAIEESHSETGIGEYPQYTRPEIFKAGKKKYRVPEVLLSGNHADIAVWRQKNRKKIT